MFIRLSPARLLLFLGLAATAAGVLGSATSTHAQASYTILHTFTGFPADGSHPNAGLIQASDGTLYGTTSGGGSVDGGTVFQLAPDGSGFTVLHSFTGGPTDGFAPFAGLIQASDGTLYGTTSRGPFPSGFGTVFQMARDGSGFTLLHSFPGGPDGDTPFAGLIQGPDGTLYGTTVGGGSFASGTVFQMARDGSGFTLLHSFTGADGFRPRAGLIQASDGTLYGTTFGSSAPGEGVVFQLTLSPSVPTRR